jgi:hypothetical protein
MYLYERNNYQEHRAYRSLDVVDRAGVTTQGFVGSAHREFAVARPLGTAEPRTRSYVTHHFTARRDPYRYDPVSYTNLYYRACHAHASAVTIHRQDRGTWAPRGCGRAPLWCVTISRDWSVYEQEYRHPPTTESLTRHALMAYDTYSSPA